MPRILPANPDAIREAVHVLRSGGVIAFPTETVYGLGARTFDQRAIETVYELKDRPADNPLIAHVLDASQARDIAAADAWTDRCQLLASRFWPGPLTLVLGKSPRVSDRATAGRPTVAVRSPSHPVARSLLQSVDEPVSAPSANRSGRVSPTSAKHVLIEFAGAPAARDLIILDGGACDVGIESTVLDLSSAKPRILRHGSVTLEQLRELIGDVESPATHSQNASPGTAAWHYAPRTPTELVSANDLPLALQGHNQRGLRCVVLGLNAGSVPPPNALIAMPHEANAYAHHLYRRLRDADDFEFDRIIVETPAQEGDVWRAIRDRLHRAAARK